MKPTVKLKWIKGLKATYKALGAKQKDQYSWLAQINDTFIFTAETDHQNAIDNVYNHKNGTFIKKLPPMSKSLGYEAISIRHSEELLSCAKKCFEKKMFCYLLLVKGTKFGTTSGGVTAAIDGHYWIITKCNGSVNDGYELLLERVEQIW